AANHAKIEVTDKAVYVIPLEGPVLLNSERIIASQQLGDADVIDVGRYRIQYFESSAIFPRDSRDRTLTASFHEANPEKAILPHIFFLSPFKKRFRRYALSLGRGDDCDISVNDPYISTRHAEIEFLNGHYHIRDLNSRNGTFLNDYRISNTKMPSKGTIRLGRLIMVYEIEVVSPDAEEAIPGITIPGPRPGAADRMIVFKSALFSQLMKLLKKIAPTEETTLLLGETGVGKDVLAVYLHSNHPSRKKHPYVAVNCAEISPTMADAQFFGHVSGAFTGAIRDHKGFFEQADKGTLFLDEIGELPTDLQAKLLRVMEDGLVRPVGGTKQIPVDVRLIAATNRDLDAGKLAGSFRADLYERFDRMLTIPPLRERKEDIVPIAKYFIRSLCSSPLTLSLDAALVLEGLPWPGNIRALRRTIRTAITNATYRESSTIERQDLEIAGDTELGIALKPTKLRQLKREAMIAHLENHNGNMIAAAKALEITRKTLYEWCKEDGINPKEYRVKGKLPK
ncbi:MAG TPA: sigma 54-interacting transcriptional regulator, partial [bacterium]|nr:sigma 54-interacting transcriptional regulator [bacterium]